MATKPHRLQVMVDDKTFTWLKSKALKKDVPISEYLRNLIEREKNNG